MKFSEVVVQTVAWLQREGRVSYRALKREFDLDDEFLADLKIEIIEAKRLAVDENGIVLVWTGNAAVVGTQLPALDLQSLLSRSSETTRPIDAQLGDFRSNSGERRQLTVMFCDMVGSMPLSRQIDLEEFRDVVQAYQHACVTVITRFGGHVAKYLGDGLLVYFGYPTAHEDDAARAVRAGLRIIDAVQELPHANRRVPDSLQVRIGIHTGLVVLGEMGSGEYREQSAVTGEAPNIAARLQELAAPNTVIISPTTYHLVTGLFECQELGPQELKGLSAPLSVYRVVQESEDRDRFEVSVRTGLTPMVGRETELELLRERWSQAKAGGGQSVLVHGEAGIGKSRLVQALKEQVVQEGATHLEFRCSPYAQNSALSPIIDHLQRFLGFRRDETPQAKTTKLTAMLASYRFLQADTVALLATLLSLPLPDNVTPLTLSPQKQKQKTHELLVAWLGEEAERGPVYSVWEDLHWADPSTLEVFSLLLERLPAMRLLTVFTCRPEFHPPWKRNPTITSLMLSRLPQPQVLEMTRKVAGGKALPTEIVRQIVTKTDGVPLFVEELTKMVIESDLLTERDTHYEIRGALIPLTIPSTLHDSLMARLDRLTTAREIAQVGATLGREFSYDLIQAVVPLREEVLQQALAQLVAAELLYQRGFSPQATYVFKHALVQDAAYESMLKSKRQQLHQRIAQVLEVQFPDIVEYRPELVAHHYTEARLSELAVPYWYQAGQGAIRRAAFAEALNHLTQGLELLQTVPESSERDRQELDLQSALGLVLQTIKGYAAPEVDSAYTRARSLCQRVGDTAQLVSVLRGQLLFYGVRADYGVALELGQQMLAVAERARELEYQVEAHLAMGLVRLYQGEFLWSRTHLEQGIALDAPTSPSRQAFHYLGHSRAMSLAYLGRTLWLLGYPDQALQRSQEGLVLAYTLAIPMTVSQAQGMHTLLHQVRREIEDTREWAEKTILSATEHGFPYWLTLSTMSKGWVLAQQGHVDAGSTQFNQGLAGYRSTGAKLGLSWLLALSGELAGKTGQHEQGSRIMTEALTLVQQTGERYYEAELYRLKGETMLQQESQKSKITDPPSLIPAPQGEAETCFLKAIDIARQQRAKSWELRAVMSLSRLWQQQGKGKEAHQMLSEIYGWFTEGFTAPDLQDAQALLREFAA
jgi:class 3 adenylate cyclase/predicted ATPase